MLKWLGAALLTGAVLLSGRYFSQSVILRRRQLEAIASMVARMEEEIRYNGADVCSLVERLQRDSLSGALPFLERCAARCRSGEPFPNAWRGALEDSERQMRLTCEEKAQLLSFGERLGATDLEGQMAHCGMYRREFERLLSEARGQEQVKTRLYRSLSMLAGAAVIILSV